MIRGLLRTVAAPYQRCTESFSMAACMFMGGLCCVGATRIGPDARPVDG